MKTSLSFQVLAVLLAVAFGPTVARPVAKKDAEQNKSPLRGKEAAAVPPARELNEKKKAQRKLFDIAGLAEGMGSLIPYGMFEKLSGIDPFTDGADQHLFYGDTSEPFSGNVTTFQLERIPEGAVATCSFTCEDIPEAAGTGFLAAFLNERLLGGETDETGVALAVGAALGCDVSFTLKNQFVYDPNSKTATYNFLFVGWALPTILTNMGEVSGLTMKCEYEMPGDGCLTRMRAAVSNFFGF